MTALPLLLILALAEPGATAHTPPPEPVATPSVHDGDDGDLPALFTYRVDGHCRVDRTRKLQGPPDVRWKDAALRFGVAREDTVWRYLDGVRSQLRERRVKLLGEMVLPGELVCLLRPSGEVMEAWLERRDADSRGRSVSREPVAVQGGRIADLGAFSLTLDPAADDDL